MARSSHNIETYRALPPIYGSVEANRAGRFDPFTAVKTEVDELMRRFYQYPVYANSSADVGRDLLAGAMLPFADGDRLMEQLQWWMDQCAEVGLPVVSHFEKVSDNRRFEFFKQMIKEGPKTTPSGQDGLNTEHFAIAVAKTVKDTMSTQLRTFYKSMKAMPATFEYRDPTCLGPIAIRVLTKRGEGPSESRGMGFGVSFPGYAGIVWAMDHSTGETALDTDRNLMGRARPKRADHVIPPGLTGGLLLGHIGSRLIVAVSPHARIVNGVQSSRLRSKYSLHEFSWDDFAAVADNTSVIVPSGLPLASRRQNPLFGKKIIEDHQHGNLPGATKSGAITVPVSGLSHRGARRLEYRVIDPEQRRRSSASIHGDSFAMNVASDDDAFAVARQIEEMYEVDMSPLTPIRSHFLHMEGRVRVQDRQGAVLDEALNSLETGQQGQRFD